MITRLLEPGDRPGWEALWQGYNAFYGRAGETALAPQIIDTAWTRLMDPTEPATGLIADGAGLLGLVHLIPHRNMIQIADTCYLQDLYTAPEARGQGVARALIAAACDWCKQQGITDIYWHTHESNDVARGLYESLARDTRFAVYRKAVD